MKFLLEPKILDVRLAREKLKAKEAYSRHQSLKAKQSVNQLLVSSKGLGAAFGAGLTKGILSSSDSTKTSSQTALARHLLSVWLASSKVGASTSE